MTKMRRMALGAVLAALSIASSGCYLWVDRAPTNLERSRRRAQAKVERLESRPAGERGKPHSLKLWAYDRGDDQLVKLSVPIWVVKKIAAHVEKDEDEGATEDDLQRYHIKVEDVLNGHRGLLVRVDSEDEEVLAWLE